MSCAAARCVLHRRILHRMIRPDVAAGGGRAAGGSLARAAVRLRGLRHRSCRSADASRASLRHTQDGHTPLLWAAQKNHPEVVRLLLDCGADKEEKNDVRAPCATAAARYIGARHVRGRFRR